MSFVIPSLVSSLFHPEVTLKYSPDGPSSSSFRFTGKQILLCYQSVKLDAVSLQDYFVSKLQPKEPCVRVVHADPDTTSSCERTYVVILVARPFETTNHRYFDLTNSRAFIYQINGRFPQALHSVKESLGLIDEPAQLVETCSRLLPPPAFQDIKLTEICQRQIRVWIYMHQRQTCFSP